MGMTEQRYDYRFMTEEEQFNLPFLHAVRDSWTTDRPNRVPAPNGGVFIWTGSKKMCRKWIAFLEACGPNPLGSLARFYARSL